MLIEFNGQVARVMLRAFHFLPFPLPRKTLIYYLHGLLYTHLKCCHASSLTTPLYTTDSMLYRFAEPSLSLVPGF
jgi:hypothetical protein